MKHSPSYNYLILLTWLKQDSNYILLPLLCLNTVSKILWTSNITHNCLPSASQAVGTVELPKQSSLSMQPLMMTYILIGEEGCFPCLVVLLVQIAQILVDGMNSF